MYEPSQHQHCFLLYLLQDAPEGKPSDSYEAKKRLTMASHTTNAQQLNITVCKSLSVVKLLTALRSPEVMSAARIYHPLRGNSWRWRVMGAREVPEHLCIPVNSVSLLLIDRLHGNRMSDRLAQWVSKGIYTERSLQRWKPSGTCNMVTKKTCQFCWKERKLKHQG